MQFFLTLLKVWQAISPYVTAENYADVLALFNQAVTDFKGGEYRQLVIHLLDGLKKLITSEEAHIRMASAAGLTFSASPGDSEPCEWSEVQKVLSA